MRALYGRREGRRRVRRRVFMYLRRENIGKSKVQGGFMFGVHMYEYMFEVQYPHASASRDG